MNDYLNSIFNDQPYAQPNEWATMLTSLANQNNAWSAEQAMKQMDFQREMSNTAHQREIADLKAAGLNPILSAKLGGASTPNGASATADSSIVSSMVSLMDKMLDVQGTSAAAAYNAVGGSSGTYGYGTNASASEDSVGDTISDLADLTGKYGIKNAINGFVHGVTGKDKDQYDNNTAYKLGEKVGGKVSSAYNDVSNNAKNVIVHHKDGTTTQGLSTGSKIISTIQRALTGSNRLLTK